MAARAAVAVSVSAGRARSGAWETVRGHRGYATTLRLGANLARGVYRVTVSAADAHGSGPVRTVLVTVGPT